MAPRKLAVEGFVGCGCEAAVQRTSYVYGVPGRLRLTVLMPALLPFGVRGSP